MGTREREAKRAVVSDELAVLKGMHLEPIELDHEYRQHRDHNRLALPLTTEMGLCK